MATAGCDYERQQHKTSNDLLDSLFSHFNDGVQPGVAIMIIHDGKIIRAEGYGFADIGSESQVSPTTSFRLASVSKQFTSMAIMLLAEEQRLSYDDRVARWLPDLAAYPEVTIRQLMNHTGGLPDYYDLIDTGNGRPTNMDAMRLLGELARPEFAPGARYEYSNSGYDMLANIVVAASGKEFPQFMHSRIFEPLGMEGATIRDHRMLPVRQRAIGYKMTDTGFVENDDDPLNGIVGSGGMYASLQDLYFWDQALYTEKLVSSSTMDEALTAAVTTDGTPVGYGFGWRLDDYHGRRRVRHGGSWVGFRTHIARYPDDRFTIIILSNRAEFDPEEYVDDLTDAYLPGK